MRTTPPCLHSAHVSNQASLVYCRTPLIASAAANAVNLSLDLFFVFVAGWGVVGAASAATIGQYVGLTTMLFMLHWKGVLRLSDLKSLPSPQELIPMAQVLSISACKMLRSGCTLRCC